MPLFALLDNRLSTSLTNVCMHVWMHGWLFTLWQWYIRACVHTHRLTNIRCAHQFHQSLLFLYKYATFVVDIQLTRLHSLGWTAWRPLCPRITRVTGLLSATPSISPLNQSKSGLFVQYLHACCALLTGRQSQHFISLFLFIIRILYKWSNLWLD